MLADTGVYLMTRQVELGFWDLTAGLALLTRNRRSCREQVLACPLIAGLAKSDGCAANGIRVAPRRELQEQQRLRPRLPVAPSDPSVQAAASRPVTRSPG